VNSGGSSKVFHRHDIPDWQPFALAGVEGSAVFSLASNIAVSIGDRLKEPANVEAAVVEAQTQSNLVNAPQWSAYGFAQGYAGLAILFGQLDRCFPKDGWEATAHTHLLLAVEGAATSHRVLHGAFSGIAGVLFSAKYLSNGGTRYRRLTAALEENLASQISDLVAEIRTYDAGIPVGLVDVISGASGVAAAIVDCDLASSIGEQLLDLVSVLIWLSENENGLPRAHCPSQFMHPSDTMSKLFPFGFVNVGLAHGVPGLLGSLALAHLRGIRLDGLNDAIARVTDWIIASNVEDNWGINWPTGVGLTLSNDPTGAPSPTGQASPSRAGWCYGSPGVARALYLAGLALGESEYLECAVGAIEAVARRPTTARYLESPTFCHGKAGLLHVLLRFANDTASKEIASSAYALLEDLISCYEQSSLLGFRSVELGGKKVDQPGLLDGAPGVALVLLAASSTLDPSWDRLFLMS